jgi:prevent-host-death family protein
MMHVVSTEEAQARLPELIENLKPDEEIIITKHNQPVARLIASRQQTPRTLGTLRGSVKYVAPDFDAPLEVFKEYME